MVGWGKEGKRKLLGDKEERRRSETKNWNTGIL
jgi:hypothetical protein